MASVEQHWNLTTGHHMHSHTSTHIHTHIPRKTEREIEGEEGEVGERGIRREKN